MKTRALVLILKSVKVLFLAVVFVAESGLLYAQVKDPYKIFNNYLAMAKKGVEYAGAPLKGKVVGFANALSSFQFCVLVENGIKKQLSLAGCDLNQGWVSMDNQFNPVVALQNVDTMLSRHPDIFIEYQLDVKTNHIVAAKFGEAKIPVVAIDVAIPGAPLVGTNNYTVAVMAGHTMAKLIREKWGGWDTVDLVVIMNASAPGEHPMLRSEGVADALADEFGIDSKQDPKVVRGRGGIGQLDQAKTAMDDVLAAHPEAVNIAVTSFNEPIMMGCITAMKEAGRWDPDNKIIVTMGVDQLGQSLIRDSLSDAGVAFFPEYYGEYIVPAVAAILTGNPVPPAIFVQNEVITRDNIDRWYPKQ
jgi:ribose transport system substrate-binding protein